MHRHTRSDAGDVSSPRSSRAASFSSDRPSVAGSVTFQMPTSARPPPAYIAASVASQIVTDHHNVQLRDDDNNADDSDHDGELLTNAIFSDPALNLLNAFLDHLLFAFLSTARSPALTAIRPAITEVLKPRLAREAMATADDELQGLIGGDEEEEFPEQPGASQQKWDTEKVWKRTRLRIMVYTRLGEMEDEDEEKYVSQERGLSMDEDEDDEAGLVSWASAIFLTSVIEYVAEQTLLVSGQASYARMSAKMRRAAQMSEDGEDYQLERIIVEDFDVEKVALNAALGRLWRTWRKRVRSPIIPLTPSRGPRSIASLSSLHSRRISHDTIDHTIMGEGTPGLHEHKPTETDIAANIPLPIGDNDVNEIEVPGLARTFEDEESSGTQTPVARPQRPSSFIMLAPAEQFRRRLMKERPVSMPPPDALPFTIPSEADAELTENEDQVFETPMERAGGSDDESYITDQHQESIRQNDEETTQNMDEETIREKDEETMRKLDEEGEADDDADMVAFAASTGMGFGMGPPTPTKPGTSGKEEDDTIGTPTQTGYAEPRVFPAKRMSIEKTGPPGVVRTFSTRSSRSSQKTPEPTSYLDDAHHDDDDLTHPDAIGVATTSNIAIPVTPSPPAELAANEQPQEDPKQKQADQQGFVELAPRHVAAATAAAAAAVGAGVVATTVATSTRKTPSPDERSRTPPRAILRKEIPAQDRHMPRRDVTPPRTRGHVLPMVQESESWPNRTPEHRTPKKQSPLNDSPKHTSSARARDSPVVVAERSVKPKSIDDSPKATLQRVSSSSSTTRSASTSILHTGRESDSSLTRPRGLSGRMSEEDRVREFDTLVKSDETVKFTLTPQNMRDIDEPPVVKKAEPAPKPTSSHKPSSSVTVYPRVNADKDNQFGSQPLPTRSGSRSNGHTAASSGPTPARKSFGQKPLAREPRIQSDSMRDFADFIRSTGPSPGREKPVQPFVNLSNSSLPSPNGSSSAISGLGRKLSTKQSPSHSKSSSTIGDGPSARPRVHMEPRSPAGQRSGNDDLIDFIRQGPPGQNNGQHRIPRSVAPFRTTVDSDQFERMLDDNGNIESAYGSQVSTNSKQSTHTSNSRTGLLPAANIVQPAYSNAPQKLSGNLSNPEPHIQRTRRRIKDPYAIDLSDEEEDDMLTALPNNGKRQEESLMDFLNSSDPPTNNEPKPFILSNDAVAAAKARARATNSSNSSLPSSNGSSATATRNGTNSRTMNRSPAALPTSPTRDEHPLRSHKPKLQARGADARGGRSERSATNDLADFLRTSGPPEPAAPPPGATIKKDEVKKSNTRFWRKKTSAYGDTS